LIEQNEINIVAYKPQITLVMNWRKINGEIQIDSIFLLISPHTINKFAINLLYFCSPTYRTRYWL